MLCRLLSISSPRRNSRQSVLCKEKFVTQQQRGLFFDKETFIDIYKNDQKVRRETISLRILFCVQPHNDSFFPYVANKKCSKDVAN